MLLINGQFFPQFSHVHATYIQRLFTKENLKERNERGDEKIIKNYLFNFSFDLHTLKKNEDVYSFDFPHIVEIWSTRSSFL